ncbi:MAG: glycerol-3-phosphate acyltransferase [Oscillospiraceae bacterium]|nr:glycerol-3-phosphate acyltransferase [Oscillospiraceae bacterium]
MWFNIIITILTAYMLGNLNGAFLVGYQVSGEDIRKKGSGNAGLTNFIRNYGVSSAIGVVATDMGKAVLSCLVGGALLAPYGYEIAGRALGGLCLILGHAFPILLGFKGGKGILSGVTVALCLDWRIGLFVFGIFLVAYWLTHYVSLGSVLSSGSFGFIYAIFHWEEKFAVCVGFFLSALIVWLHRGNIKRLLKGEERKTKLLGGGNQK